MKKQLLLFAMILLPLVASADPVEINGIYYDLITEGNTAVVISNPNKYTGNITIPEYVKYNDIDYSVISIGNDAFYDCTELSSITIPNSVTSIGERAFSNCENLVSIDIPNGVTIISPKAFQNCRKLKHVKIPKSLKYIYGNAFKGCYAPIESVEIEDLESWLNIYFENPSCNPLLRGGLLYENGVVVEDLVIPENITSIGSSVLYGCGSIKTLTLHSKVESIGAYAFMCNNISKVYCHAEKIPQTGDNLFGDITNATLYVPESSIMEYMTNEPWCYFGNIFTLSGEDPSVNITDVNNNLNCSVDWNGSQASSVTPWGSNYARGVNATIYNFSNVNITVTQIDAYINDYPIGSIPDFEQTLIEGGSNKTFSFSVTNNYAMPSTLPWLKIHYKIIRKEFIKDSREPGTTNISEGLINDNAQDIEVYSIDGRKLDKPQRGLNIIRTSNGKTKKVVIK